MIAESFNTLMKSMFVKYRGCLIEKDNGWYKIFGESYPTIDLARKAVDERYGMFENIIKTQNENKFYD